MRLVALAAGLVALSACNPSNPGAERSDGSPSRPGLALMTSLPILWNEGDIGEILADDAAPNWVRAEIEQDYRLHPLDRLIDLDGEARLLLAQPRALAPDENVALDDWVRGGGRVLVFADPMLTAHSRFALGDARAPQAMAMLSPILARWGLAMRYDPRQPEGPRMSAAIGQGDRTALPVDQAGTLALTGEGHEAACDLAASGLVARCRIGRGSATIVADAALIEDADDSNPAARQALQFLLDEAFAPTN